MIRSGERADVRTDIGAFDELIEAALRAQAHAYAPYSSYRVGAAVLDDLGRITPGCNVESAAYGATICAERGAVAGAVAAGATTVRVCVTVTADAEPGSCCGICRQLLAEFGPDLVVVNASSVSDRVRWGRIGDWLPGSFTFEPAP